MSKWQQMISFTGKGTLAAVSSLFNFFFTNQPPTFLSPTFDEKKLLL